MLVYFEPGRRAELICSSARVGTEGGAACAQWVSIKSSNSECRIAWTERFRMSGSSAEWCLWPRTVTPSLKLRRGLLIGKRAGRCVSPLVYPPGSSWGYSVAYDVLGALIARAAGATLPSLVATSVTGPLAMRDTAFSIVDPARLAVPYVSGMPPRPMADPEVVPFLPGTAGIRMSP